MVTAECKKVGLDPAKANVVGGLDYLDATTNRVSGNRATNRSSRKEAQKTQRRTVPRSIFAPLRLFAPVVFKETG